MKSICDSCTISSVLALSRSRPSSLAHFKRSRGVWLLSARQRWVYPVYLLYYLWPDHPRKILWFGYSTRIGLVLGEFVWRAHFAYFERCEPNVRRNGRESRLYHSICDIVRRWSCSCLLHLVASNGDSLGRLSYSWYVGIIVFWRWLIDLAVALNRMWHHVGVNLERGTPFLCRFSPN